MEDEKYSRYDSLPIPTYEEATSSRPASSTTNRGAEEISDDAERQGLLGREGGQAPRNGPYQAPTVESPRASEESDLYLPEVTGEDEETAELRQDMEQMEVDDSDTAAYRRARMRNNFSKRLNYFTHTLSSIHLPSFRSMPLPSLGSITSRLPNIPDHFRIGLPVLARLFGLFLIALLIYVLFALDIIPNSSRMAQHYDPESVRARVQAEVDVTRIAEYLRYITSFDHVAGTEGDLFLAKWQADKWEASLLDEVAILPYYVYLNYPTEDGRRVAIVDPPELAWQAQLEENTIHEVDGKVKQQTLSWHGNSRAGNVTGPLVYANGGSREDFQKLKDMGISVNGSIALVRYYHTQEDPALKIKAAELAGAVGCLIYSDPKEDGFLKGKSMSEEAWRPNDTVQRAGVSLTNWVVGDVLTPGWPSTLDSERIKGAENPGLNNIPSLPLAWRNAQKLLTSIKGHGQKVPTEDWVGGVPEVDEWWTGDSSSPIVLLQNIQSENALQQIWNVHGVIRGMETPQKKVVIGNHRDAWCFGSVSPGSGTAVLMEVVNIFGTLRKLGWRPLRTIEFVSWDAAEYNLIGSTEYVESNLDFLRANGIGYLNVDAGVFGPDFRATASPVFERALLHVLDRVSDPAKNVTLRQLRDDSKSKLEGPNGADSDYVAFQDLAGVSSIDFGFEGPKNGYPRGSCYETFEWMEMFGDPGVYLGTPGVDLHNEGGFQYHKVLAQVWALLILELADRPILPYDLSVYRTAIQGYIIALEADANNAWEGEGNSELNVQPLRDAANILAHSTQEFHAFDNFWTSQVLGRGGFESNAFALKRIEHNDRLAAFETDLLDLPGMFPGEEDHQHGIPGREQYKHVIFGPQAWSNYTEAYFPAIREALYAGNWTEAQRHVDKAAKILDRAARRLVQ